MHRVITRGASAAEVQGNRLPVGPRVHGEGRELRALVAREARWPLAPREPRGQSRGHILAVKAALGHERLALPRMDIDHGQHPKRPPTGRLIVDEVPRPP